MLRVIFIFLFLALFANVSANHPAEKDLLSELDRCIKQESGYEDEKKLKIRQLTSRLYVSGIPVSEQYQLCSRLYREYEAYKYDSAYHYAGKMVSLANLLGNDRMMRDASISMAYCCLSAGLFKEASEIALSCDTLSADPEERIAAYSLLSKLNYDMAVFANVEPYAGRYWQNVVRYSQCIIDLLQEDDPRALSFIVTMHRARHDYAGAIEINLELLSQEHMDERSYAMSSAGLGYLYLLSGDTAEAIPYLSLAAIADIKAAIKETTALCKLADLLYGQGDLTRAYSYARQAMDNANFYNARHRKMEVGNILPIIDASRFDMIKKQNRQLIIYAVLISVLFVMFLVSMIIILMQVKKLNKARRLIQRQNKDLHRINGQLKEVDRIKDEYIGYFFSVNSEYINKIEDFQKLVSRKIAARQFDDLSRLFKAAEIQKEREDMFSSFDRIFMKLFPDFTGRFNALFEPEDCFVPKSEGVLTTEMRIFALIRLGVTENEKIARFLNYSVNTINTYKTKVKNRSIVANELFEHKIMEIESVETDHS